MRVVFDQKLMAGDYPDPAVLFFTDLVKRMAWLSPDDEFVILLPPHRKPKEALPDNMFFVRTGNTATSLLGSHFFRRMRLPGDVKALDPDVFVGIDNPLTYRYKSGKLLLLLDPPSVENLDKSWNRTLASVSQVLCFANINSLVIPMEKLLRLDPPFPAQEMRATWGRKESIKVQYSGGHDYFLFSGDLDSRHQLLDLLKAFSQFKQRQQSSMRLYFAGKDTKWTSTFEKLLDSYKYRSDVVILRNPSPDDVRELMAAAYALVYPALEDSLPVTVLQAMSAGLPVIASKLPVLEEWAGDSIIQVSGSVSEGFSKAMQQLFKEESGRDLLIEKADALQQHDPENLPRQFLGLLRKASETK
ncbi:MAG: glycosyltransferase [Chitinophagaceae bacterium]